MTKYDPVLKDVEFTARLDCSRITKDEQEDSTVRKKEFDKMEFGVRLSLLKNLN